MISRKSPNSLFLTCLPVGKVPNSKHRSHNSLFIIHYSASSAGNGYIAITSAIIITILILTVVLTTSSAGFFGRFNILGTLLKERGSALADACADTALLNLVEDIDYAGNENIVIASSTCTILPIETNGDQKTIKTQATEGDTETNHKVILDTTDFTIVFWDEVATF